MIQLKTAEEIKRVRESCRICAEAHKEVERHVQPGITTGELDKIAQSYIEKHGGVPAFLNYMGYPATLCVSVNNEVIHGIPGKRVIREGDIVSLDLGVNLDGFFSDMARTVPVGKVAPDALRLVKETRKCLELALEQAVDGKRLNDVGGAVWNHAKKFSYGVVKDYCGHGVGFSPHEEPQIPNYIRRMPNPRLRPGMVIAIEPMINIGTGDVVLLDNDWTVETADGSLSAHWEHTVAIVEGGSEILTSFEDLDL
jgi:methionyl aminopeptidase